MYNCLAIYLTKSKSMVSLISSSSEILVDPYKINHSINDFSIKQSGKSIDIKDPISKSSNKYMRKILFVSCLNIVRLSSKCHIGNDIENYYRKNVMKVNSITLPNTK